MFKKGDLLQFKVELLIRNDGMALNEAEATAEEGRVPRDWLKNAEMLPAGTFCTYMCPSDDPGRVIVAKNGFGRMFDVNISDLILIASIDDSPDDGIADPIRHNVDDESIDVDCSDL